MLAVLSSVTTASRIKKYMEEKGMEVRMIQTPKGLARGGCGYSLIVPDEAAEEIRTAAQKMKARVRGFYLEEGTGKDKKYIPLK